MNENMTFYEVAQPEDWEFSEADDIFIKQMSLPKKGMVVPQHAHTYDHYTMLARGTLKVMANGVELGTFTAPKPIFIASYTKHLLIAMEDDTLAYCIHNLSHTGKVEIADEHRVDIRKAG